MKTVGPCVVPGCERLGNVPGSAHGLCRPHYQQKRADEAAACSVPCCSTPVRAKGLCPKHLTRLSRRGTVDDPPARDIAAEFWSQVTVDGSCWIWLGRTGTKGYGRLDPRRGMHLLAHRFAYEQLVGPVPPGLTLDHLCRVQTCVNPWHLDPVPAAENTRRQHQSRKDAS